MTATATAPLPHLLGLQGMPAAELRSLLSAAMRSHELADRFPGRLFANLFFEDSTRTRTSFSIAAKKLGASVVDLVGASSSVNKGETLIDTARIVEANGVDAIVMRARQAGAAALVARHVACPVVNAGDGRHEHPTQGLLDIFTLAEHYGRLGAFDLSGLTLAIVGDIAASRVARSNIAGMTALGAKVVCVGPPAMAPGSLESLGVTISRDLDVVVPEVDAVMMLRIQFERYGDPHDKSDKGLEKGGDFKKPGVIESVREFRAFYSLTPERAARMKPNAVVMHPGPINRGIELDSEVADGPRSVILKQVANGLKVRMAVLARCLKPELA